MSEHLAPWTPARVVHAARRSFSADGCLPATFEAELRRTRIDGLAADGAAGARAALSWAFTVCRASRWVPRRPAAVLRFGKAIVPVAAVALLASWPGSARGEDSLDALDSPNQPVAAARHEPDGWVAVGTCDPSGTC